MQTVIVAQMMSAGGKERGVKLESHCRSLYVLDVAKLALLVLGDG